MSEKWFKASYPNMQFKKHTTRKHGVKFDKYFRGSYQVSGKRRMINFGWSSEGWTELSVWEKINKYKNNAKTGEGPISLREERENKENIEKMKEEKANREKIENVTFKEFFKTLYFPIAKTNKKPESWRKEEEHFKNWLNPEIGHIPIKKITSFNLEKVKKKMLDTGKAPRTIQYCFATFRQTWNYARLINLVVTDSPTRRVRLPKVENQRLRFLSHKEAESLLTVLEESSRQVHDMTLLSLHTGIRAGEIFSLTWGVVDFKNGSLLIRDSKGRPRHVYLTNATKLMLKAKYNKQNASDLIFKDINGKQIQRISKTFDRTIEKLGFNNGVTDRRDRATFHTCRHTFASWHVQNGTDLYTVKELLGHSTIQLTERYSHLRPDGLKEATRNFDKTLDVINIPGIESA